MKNKLLVFSIVFFFPSFLLSQNHNELWLRQTLHKRLNKNNFLSFEFQERTQNNFQKISPLNNSLVYSFRIIYNHQLTPKSNLIFSPFAFFQDYKLISNAKNEVLPFQNEIRNFLFFQSKIFSQNKISLQERVGLENRYFYKNEKDIFRFRNQFSIFYTINTHLNIQLFDELFHNIIPTFNIDQNRLTLLLNHKMNKQINLNLGLQNIQKYKIQEWALLAYCSYTF